MIHKKSYSQWLSLFSLLAFLVVQGEVLLHIVEHGPLEHEHEGNPCEVFKIYKQQTGLEPVEVSSSEELVSYRVVYENFDNVLFLTPKHYHYSVRDPPLTA